MRECFSTSSAPGARYAFYLTVLEKIFTFFLRKNEEFYHEPHEPTRTLLTLDIPWTSSWCSLRTDGSLKAALLYNKQRHLFVLRCATLLFYTATPCVYLASLCS